MTDRSKVFAKLTVRTLPGISKSVTDEREMPLPSKAPTPEVTDLGSQSSRIASFASSRRGKSCGLGSIDRVFVIRRLSPNPQIAAGMTSCSSVFRFLADPQSEGGLGTSKQSS